MVQPVSLPLTGERMHPEYQWGDRTMREHWARYHFAASIAEPGFRILDCASGEGYGTHMLSQQHGVGQVIGVDNSEEAVAHASDKYVGPAFLVDDIRALPRDWTHDFDMVVSFETIEHVREVEQALKELRRVLHPKGYFVCSTPNRGVYPAGNPFHERELTTEELAQMLAMQYEWVELYRQDWTEATILRPMGPERRDMPASIVVGPVEHRIPPEHYVVAVCGPEPLALPQRVVVT